MLADLCVALARPLYNACPILIPVCTYSRKCIQLFGVQAFPSFPSVAIHCRDTKRSKRMRCYTGGNAIVMQLDRHHCGSKEKYQEHMAFPAELDMQPWMHPESPDVAEGCSVVYDLACIIVHKGTGFNGGHNIAVCRLGPGEGMCQLVTSFRFRV